MAPVFAQINEHKLMVDQRFDNLKKIHKSLDNLNQRIAFLEANNNKLEIQQQMADHVLAKINRPLPSNDHRSGEPIACVAGG